MMYLPDDMTEAELAEARDEQRSLQLPSLAEVLALVIEGVKEARAEAQRTGSGLYVPATWRATTADEHADLRFPL